jgi:hypothetical protein
MPDGSTPLLADPTAPPSRDDLQFIEVVIRELAAALEDVSTAPLQVVQIGIMEMQLEELRNIRDVLVAMGDMVAQPGVPEIGAFLIIDYGALEAFSIAV